MNDHAPHQRREPTQAAEGLPRWRWSLAEFERFIDLGILTEDDRVELIGGELVPMAAKGVAHENVKGELQDWLHGNLPRRYRIVTELGWRPGSDTYCEPDLIVFPRSFKTLSKVPGSAALLIIEIADTTLKSDLTTKAALYARLAVREYWVVNSFTLETHVHRNPSQGAYLEVKLRKPATVLKPLLLPGVELRLKDLEIEAE